MSFKQSSTGSTVRGKQVQKATIGVWGAVPIDLLAENPPGSAVKVYVALASFQGTAERAWPCKDEIQSRAGIGNDVTYYKGLSWLKEHGWIESSRRGLGLTNIYSVRLSIHPDSQESRDTESLESSDSLYITKTPKENTNTKPPDDALADSFQRVWDIYPRKEGRTQAANNYRKLVRRISAEDLHAAVENYLDHIKQSGIEKQFVIRGGNFFSPAQARYEDYLPENYQRQKKVDPAISKQLDALRRQNAAR